MKQPAPDALRVPHGRLQSFVHRVARKVGIPEDQAELLSRILIDSDLRGVLSHGSHQVVRYAREIRSGGINPRPHIRLVQESPNSLLMDGDGGLGYFPAHEATRRIIDKATQLGMAAMVTRNHGHIGAAGIYARMTLQHDLLTFVTSGVRLSLKSGDSVIKAAGASPMAFSAPALHEPPLILDCGVTHGIQGEPPNRDQIIRLDPGIVLRALGFGTICQAWGGLLAGLPIDSNTPPAPYRNANQGAMLFTFRISLFADPLAFRQQIDEYARQARALMPLQGTEGAYLPGGIEAEHERQYKSLGVPLSDRHMQDLENLAQELDLAVPWQ